MVNAENGQILRFDAVYVGSVRNGEGTTLQVIDAVSVELGKRVTWARIISLANIGASLGCGPPLGGSLVASQLGHGGTAGGEFEKVARVGGVLQVCVEPPLLESVLLKRCHRPVVVGEILHTNIEPPH